MLPLFISAFLQLMLASQVIGAEQAPSKFSNLDAQSLQALSDEEQSYVKASTSYLATFFEHGEKVGAAMTGLRDRSTTLADVKQALRAALAAEGARYEQDMVKFNRAAPARFSGAHADIVSAHRDFVAGMQKFLAAFESNTKLAIRADMADGEALVEDAAKKATRAVDAINAELKKVKKK